MTGARTPDLRGLTDSFGWLMLERLARTKANSKRVAQVFRSNFARREPPQANRGSLAIVRYVAGQQSGHSSMRRPSPPPEAVLLRRVRQAAGIPAPVAAQRA